MSENIILKKNPKIEFQFLDNGFQLIDEQTLHGYLMVFHFFQMQNLIKKLM